MNILNIIKNASWIRFKRFLKKVFGPKHLRLADKQMKTIIERCQKYQKVERDNCPHQAGCNKLSDLPSPFNSYTSIVWHHIDLDTWFGICTVCQRQFWPSDTDYDFWRKQKSFNRPSGTFRGVNPPPYYGDHIDIQKNSQICFLDVECGLVPDPEKKLIDDDGDDPDNWSDEKLKQMLDDSYKLVRQRR